MKQQFTEALEIAERIVVILAAIAAFFPLWQWYQERDERQLSRLATVAMAGDACDKWVLREQRDWETELRQRIEANKRDFGTNPFADEEEQKAREKQYLEGLLRERREFDGNMNVLCEWVQSEIANDGYAHFSPPNRYRRATN